MSISAMKQALDLLETSWGCGHQETLDRWNETIEVLYEAIEQAEKQEGWVLREVYFSEGEPISHREPQWVGLTDEEMREVARESQVAKQYKMHIPAKGKVMEVIPVFSNIRHFAELIEFKLKEKNCPSAD